MKIVVLNGSPRKGGNTEIMAQAFAEAARKNQNEVSVLDVASMNICGCLGCKYCWAHKGECVQKDDMGKVFVEACSIYCVTILTADELCKVERETVCIEEAECAHAVELSLAMSLELVHIAIEEVDTLLQGAEE